ncbi:hypothetical protein SAMN05443432_102294 [Roseovarius litoreus]|uniref:Uncharacterized protein n=1 Tax=Roseovarius litoreus TaxID=1155722 RepID=A0A1M7CTF7_9RHOB|nr:hypothetical protein SAMN05443432_102294 [Roseovarius litoreus]
MKTPPATNTRAGLEMIERDSFNCYSITRRAVVGNHRQEHDTPLSTPATVGGLSDRIPPGRPGNRRHDGFMFRVRDGGHAHRLIADIGAVMEGQK